MWQGIKRYKDSNGIEWVFVKDEKGQYFTKSLNEYQERYNKGKADKELSAIPFGEDPNKGLI